MMPRGASNTLLTGLPRSGTTLACVLLNEVPDTLALPEPMRLERHGDRARAVREIAAFMDATRRSVLAEKTAACTHVGGAIVDNFADAPAAVRQLRGSRAAHGPIRIDKQLSPRFHLVVKHPGEFSALADLLAERFHLVALVRHPLDVLAAWQTVDMPVQRGHLPMAEAFQPDLAALLAAIPGRMERQVALMGWLFDTYARLPPGCVIRYEDMVADPGAALAPVVGGLQPSAHKLQSFHAADRYPHVDLRPLARALLPIRHQAEHFYPGFEASLQPWLAR